MKNNANKGKLGGKNKVLKSLPVRGFDEKPRRIRLRYSPLITAQLKEKAEALKDTFSRREIAKILGVGRMFINKILK